MNAIGCPHCGHLMRLPEDVVQTKCDKCKKPVSVTAKTSMPLSRSRAKMLTPEGAPELDEAPKRRVKISPTSKEAWYFSEASGEETGPVTFANLQVLAQEGLIDPDTIVRNGADWRWVAASRIPGLFDG
jgi:hypothetical protein